MTNEQLPPQMPNPGEYHSKLLRMYYQAIGKGKMRNVPWPWEITTTMAPILTPGSVTIFTGSPGAGKTFTMLQCLGFWLSRSVPTSLLMLEGDKESLMLRAVAQMTQNAAHMNLEWVEKNQEEALKQLDSYSEEINQISNAIENGCLHKNPTYMNIKIFLDQQGQMGTRICIVDPITAADGEASPWICDKALILDCQKLAQQYAMSVMLVTHPAKSQGVKIVPSMDNLAGGVAVSRASQSVIWLERVKEQPYNCYRPQGGGHLVCNRHMHLLKIRHGEGQGEVIGCNFEPYYMKMIEQGVIIKED